jgi:hypothetical protein
MKKTFLLILLIFAGMYLNAQIDNCLHTTTSWKSEKEAIISIESSSFRKTETVYGDEASWLGSAHFYSCDQDFGFMIVKSAKKSFVHQGVPVKVWEAFKSAKSKGGYYNFYIKNKFRIEKHSENIEI